MTSGMVSPLGVGAAQSWNRLIDGHSGIKSLANDQEYSQLPPMLCGTVPRGSDGFDPEKAVGRHMARVHSKALQFAVAAVRCYSSS